MKVRVIIDRIEENGLAVLEIEGLTGDFIWPVKFLPPDAHEGSVLDLTIESNPEAEAEQRRAVRALQQELLERSRKIEERE